MANTYGITSQGFVPKQQNAIISEINSIIQAIWGPNVNLGPSSNFGQFAGIFSEREALIWQVVEAVYNSQYPSGAEGTSVDNILALNNLRRLPATATVTDSENDTQTVNPVDGVTLYGLLMWGTPGTIITLGSTVETSASPPLSFLTQNNYTIGSLLNAVQNLYFSNVPDSGSFAVRLYDPAGEFLTTQLIPFNSLGVISQLNISTTPSSSTHFALSLEVAGTILNTANISTAGAFPAYTAIQSAIRAVSGYGAVSVSGAAGVYQINWGSIVNPLLTVANNKFTFTVTSANATAGDVYSNNGVNFTVENTISSQTTLITDALSGSPSTSGTLTKVSGAGDATITFSNAIAGANNSTGAAITTIDSIQASINNLYDSANLYYPFTDLLVTGSIAGSNLTFTYGGGPIASKVSGQVSSNPSCASQQQALFSAPTGENTLFSGATFTTIQPSNTTIGIGVWGTGANLSVTQGLGTAYGTINGIAVCTVEGPNNVADGSLSVIGSAISGWQGVVNQLACITGSNLEDDTQALTRRAEQLSASASTPLASIIDVITTLVEPDSGIVIGFENTTQAALQILTFGSVPSTGSFNLTVGTQLTGPISTFTADAIQTAIQLLIGYENVLVTGGQTGANPPIFTIDFNGSLGGQPQTLVTISPNTTGVVILPTFGRPGGSFEIVVGDQGAITDKQIAQAILANKAAGVQAYGDVTTTVFDAYNNTYVIGFSKPSPINFYVVISLKTDYYNTPGNSSSGVNPLAQFNPGSIPTIIQDILTIGNSFGIGATKSSGQVIGFGSNGLIGAFNSVAGIISYTLFFDTIPNPVTNTNVSLLSEEQAVFTQLNTSVSWS